MTGTAINPLWHLHDELTVEEAAALLAGHDPSYVDLRENDKDIPCEFSDLSITRSLLMNSINAGKLRATIRRDERMLGWDEFSNNEGEHDPVVIQYRPPNWRKTTVSVDILKEWLISRGLRTGFFFPDASNDTPDYLDPHNPRYAPKLAAAAQAWQAVTNPNGKSPKQALVKWLREHAAEYGLSDDEGKPNETGIEEVAKVANWLPGGGASKTPGA